MASAADSSDVREQLPLHKLPAGSELLLVALAGSKAYGTDHPDSDDDLRGVYLAPTADVLSLRPPRQTVENDEGVEPDVVLHELHKFLYLAAVKANPAVLEWLWSPVLYSTAKGELLLAHRDLLLSKKVFNTFGGFARGSLEQAKRGVGGSRGVKHLKRVKFLLHLVRLMEQGTHLLRTGEMRVRVEDPERLWALAEGGLDVVVPYFDELEVGLQAALEVSPLPDEPDFEALKQLMAQLRDLPS